mmetsp:Transcript_31655/g.38238  ORF Transcript_31655/g.38238 Transcript_31655/m.38238 type:complete len:370 (-) Transcript_31655:95-1204(-)
MRANNASHGVPNTVAGKRRQAEERSKQKISFPKTGPQSSSSSDSASASHLVACPLCSRHFHRLMVEAHCATCNRPSTSPESAESLKVQHQDVIPPQNPCPLILGPKDTKDDKTAAVTCKGAATSPASLQSFKGGGQGADRSASSLQSFKGQVQQHLFKPPSSKLVQLSTASWMRVQGGALKVSSEEFESLWSQRPEEQQFIVLFGKQCEIPRKSRLYVVGEGTSYQYSGVVQQGHPIKDPILQRALAIAQAEAADFTYNGILVNWYEGGEQYMGAHSDDERDLVKKAPIFSFSLGAPRLFRVHSKTSKSKDCLLIGPEKLKTLDTWMNDGDLIVMGGNMQEEFKHSVPKGKSYAGRRINLTVRAFRPNK